MGDGLNEFMGLYFVFCNVDGIVWYKDTFNGNVNYYASCIRVKEEDCVVDEFVDIIMCVEVGGLWWLFMYCFNFV